MLSVLKFIASVTMAPRCPWLVLLLLDDSEFATDVFAVVLAIPEPFPVLLVATVDNVGEGVGLEVGDGFNFLTPGIPS